MLITLANKQSYAAAAAGTSILINKTPFLDSENCTAHINYSTDAAGTGVVKIQGSDDGTTWTDLFTSPASPAPDIEADVICSKYMRANVSTTGSAGTVSVYLSGNT